MEPGDLATLHWPEGIIRHSELVGPPNNRRRVDGGVQCYVLAMEDRDDPETTASPCVYVSGWVARSCNRFLAGTPVICTGKLWSSTYIQFMVAGRLLWAQKKYLELLA